MKRTLCTLALALLVGTAAPAQVFTEGSLRDIRPEGWLRETLLLQRDGLTGHPEALSYPYNTCLWDGEIPRMGTHGSEWWRYEQTAYYTDGLLRLGYVLGDEDLVRKGEAGVDYTLAHPQENGRLGNPKIESLWPMAVFFRAMQARYYDSGDPAILEALTRNYLSIPLRQLADNRNIVNVEGMLWTAARTGDDRLVAKADSAYRYKELVGGERWTYEVNPDFLTAPEAYNVHGVTMCEMLKLPILLYAATGKESYKELAITSLDRLVEEDMLPDGVITSAEYLQGRGILNSHETCDITDFTWTLGAFLEVLGEVQYADAIERAVFNAGMGAVTPDWKALQYFSSVNQFLATGTSNHNPFKFGSTWMAYRPTHETECCAGNVHRFLPNYAARMWLRGTGETAVAALYGPSRFRFNDHVTLVEETSYPYDETVTFRVSATRKERFTLQVRIPYWCHNATLTVNGKPVKADLKPGTFFGLRRKFKDGDEIRLVLPMRIVKQETAGGGVFFERGPLVYSYAIPARWEKDETVYANMNGKFPDNPDFPCWSLTPDGPWNYAVEESAEASVCRDCDGIALQVPARHIRWDLAKGRVLPQGVRPDFGGGTGNNFEEGRRERPRISREERERRMRELLAEKGVDIDLTPDLPEHPEPLDGETVLLKLVPYGQTQLRLTVFPVIR
ncbi:MAG: glycoside hydrolase family 127 protein [Bacteroidales bacterium]|nr:glycoside hydrolase family 127 protein [Bacteroidales bacterium]